MLFFVMIGDGHLSADAGETHRDRPIGCSSHQHVVNVGSGMGPDVPADFAIWSGGTGAGHGW